MVHSVCIVCGSYYSRTNWDASDARARKSHTQIEVHWLTIYAHSGCQFQGTGKRIPHISKNLQSVPLLSTMHYYKYVVAFCTYVHWVAYRTSGVLYCRFEPCRTSFWHGGRLRKTLCQEKSFILISPRRILKSVLLDVVELFDRHLPCVYTSWLVHIAIQGLYYSSMYCVCVCVTYDICCWYNSMYRVTCNTNSAWRGD